ncbi:MAG TPA: integrase core domain-containing protein, partial [Longimicrobiaceae bacterium]|nr:integrase core domain-containing protein [Longimicrobiaceae bacterium]
QQIFRGREEAEVLAEHYRLEYNHVRPHSALGYKTPARFAAQWEPANVASAPAALRPSPTPPAEGKMKNVLQPALP